MLQVLPVSVAPLRKALPGGPYIMLPAPLTVFPEQVTPMYSLVLEQPPLHAKPHDIITEPSVPSPTVLFWVLFSPVPPLGPT